jgi:hypothetical protein
MTFRFPELVSRMMTWCVGQRALDTLDGTAGSHDRVAAVFPPVSTSAKVDFCGTGVSRSGSPASDSLRIVGPKAAREALRNVVPKE